MKFTKLVAVGVAALGMFLGELPASAQVAIDTFSQPRTIVPTGLPRILDASAAVFTNGPIDIGGFLGTASIDVFSCTNAGGALTLSIYTSQDQTNLTALANYALISSATAYTYTNLYYGSTNLYATNRWLLPGTLTAATPSTAGFAGFYLDQTTVPFTNSGAITITAKGYYKVGFRAQDAKRYMYFVWTPTGSSSNDIVGLTLTGSRYGEVLPGQ